MKPPPCALLELFLDNRLEPAERDAFQVHLQGCASCQAKAAQWERTGARLTAWAAPYAQPPTDDQRRVFRALAEVGERPASWGAASWALTFTALAGVAVALFTWRGGPPEPTEWELTMEVGSTTQRFEQVAWLGAAEADRRFRIGPDAVEVTRKSEVEVLEKSIRRTRLRLTRGALTAKVDPAHGGRRFVVESDPYRVTVVGTVFEVSRDDRGLQVITREGQVQVERLGSAGVVLENHQVSAGSQLSLREAAATADAGDARQESEPLPEELPTVASGTRPSAALLLSWRKRAGRGECGAVLVETQAPLQRWPSHSGMLRLVADCERKLGQPKRAESIYQRLIKVTSGEEAAEALLLAVSLRQEDLRDHPGVLRMTGDLKRVRASGPLLAALHLRRAQSLRAVGRDAAALAEIDFILERFAQTPAAAEALRLKTALRGR